MNIKLLNKIAPLSSGAHEPPNGEYITCCVMEAVSFVAGEKWSDTPECVCPVLGVFLRSWNDALPDNERDALLRPLILKLIGTRSTKEVEHRRSSIAADWLVRVNTPAWLRLAGLTDQADALSGLPEITDRDNVSLIRPVIEAAKRDAEKASAAAWAADWDPASDAARDAARDAASAAARDAASAATCAAAGDAAWTAALVAVCDAKWDVLSETKKELQRSALTLVERMIECGGMARAVEASDKEAGHG